MKRMLLTFDNDDLDGGDKQNDEGHVDDMKQMVERSVGSNLIGLESIALLVFSFPQSPNLIQTTFQTPP